MSRPSTRKALSTAIRSDRSFYLAPEANRRHRAATDAGFGDPGSEGNSVGKCGMAERDRRCDGKSRARDPAAQSHVVALVAAEKPCALSERAAENQPAPGNRMGVQVCAPSRVNASTEPSAFPVTATPWVASVKPTNPQKPSSTSPLPVGSTMVQV